MALTKTLKGVVRVWWAVERGPTSREPRWRLSVTDLLSNGSGGSVVVMVEEWNLMRTGLAVFVCGTDEVVVDVEEWEFGD